jgi:CheY-like chemotaxis protein
MPPGGAMSPAAFRSRGSRDDDVVTTGGSTTVGAEQSAAARAADRCRAARPWNRKMSHGRGDPGGRALILVVERDPHVRELEAFFLEEAGYAVEFTADGEAALQRAHDLRPDMVITEVLVPKLDGLALCRRLKASSELGEIQVLVFSILAASARAKEAGADAFLLKPLAERRLVETVRELLARSGDGRPGGAE